MSQFCRTKNNIDLRMRKWWLVAALLSLLLVSPSEAQNKMEYDCRGAFFGSQYGYIDCGALNHWAYLLGDALLSFEHSPSEVSLFWNLAEAQTTQRGRVALSLFELTGLTFEVDGSDASGAAFEAFLLSVENLGWTQEEIDSSYEVWSATKNVLFETIYKDGVLTAFAGLIFLEHGPQAAINFMDAVIIRISDLRKSDLSPEETFDEFAVWLNELFGIDLKEDVICYVNAIRSGTNIRSRPSTSSARLGTLTGEKYEVIARIIGDDGWAWWRLAQGGYVRHDVVTETVACQELW